MVSHWCVVAVCVCSFVLGATDATDTESSSPRTPRCIVVQKQSGSKDNLDYEDDYKGPTPKGRRTNKLTAHTKDETEELSELNENIERLKTLPVNWFNKKFLSKFIGL
ncbi:uncharacterized protein LOC128682500 [Plodia interpunctella]|uniref:uncharacterized protein LOC128682500 n=1 Tax=Plodia interpunctella TaxID=58824 RepID=UPI00236838A3|nr:uncharacterized protein LOC128682500 [Plodia interpunctella]